MNPLQPSPSDLFLPSPSQQEFLNKFESFLTGDEGVPLMLLKGAAGTGKTKMIRSAIDLLESKGFRAELAAPTGRAAKVLSATADREAGTLHSFLYSYDKLVEVKSPNEKSEYLRYYFELRQGKVPRDVVLIVDEASMVGDNLNEGEFLRFGSGRLLKDLIQYLALDEAPLENRVLFVGDPYQLPPVGSKKSPALNGDYLQRKYGLPSIEHELQEVQRQESHSGILTHARMLRKALVADQYPSLSLDPLPPDVTHTGLDEWRSALREGPGASTVIVASSNKMVKDYNDMARGILWENHPVPQPGEPILLMKNVSIMDHALANGEILSLIEASPDCERRRIFLKRNVDDEVKTEEVELAFRHCKLRYEGADTPLEFSCLVNDNLLWSANPQPSKEEMRALLVDFRMRHPDLKPGTPEYQLAIREDRYFNALQLKFGYAMTCHKAQGGEWEKVLVDCEGRKGLNEETFRWLYTAITRARNNICLLNAPQLKILSSASVLIPATGSPVSKGDVDTFRDALVTAVKDKGWELCQLATQSYVIQCSFQKEEQSARLRMTHNKKSVITSLQWNGSVPSDVQNELNPCVQPFIGYVLDLGHNSSPPPETMGWKGADPSDAQKQALEAYQQKMSVQGVVFHQVTVRGPYQMTVELSYAQEKTTVELYVKSNGVLSKILVNPNQVISPEFAEKLATIS